MKRLAFLTLILALAVNAHAFILVGSIGQTPATTYAPNAPTSPSASAGNAQNTITWTASATDGTHSAPTQYNLLWGTSTGSEPNTISNVTSGYVHSSLTNGTAYYYKVQAYNGAGTANSTEVNGTPTSAGGSAITFTTYATGAGAITTPGGGVAYHMAVSGSSDTAILVYGTGITQSTHTIKSHFTVTAVASGSSPDSYRPLALSCATSAPTTRSAAFTPNQGIDVVYIKETNGTYHCYIAYNDTSGSYYYWNGSSWTGTATYFSASVGTKYTVILSTTSTQWQVTLKSGDETTTVAQTSFTSWSSIKNLPTTPWLFTDLYGGNSGTTTVDVNDHTIQ